MVWEKPTFVEIKMDSEVSSYQEDRDWNPPDEVEAQLEVRPSVASA